MAGAVVVAAGRRHHTLTLQAPLWLGDEIFFRSLEGQRMMAAPVNTEDRLSVGTPQVLFKGNYALGLGTVHPNYDVSADAQLFFMVDRP